MPKTKHIRALTDRGLLDPSKSVNTQETFRGFITSFCNSLIVSIIMTICKIFFNMDIQTIALVVNTILANISSYSLDIMFAKRRFKLPNSVDEVEVSYTDFYTRFKWLISSYFSNYFIKFLTVVVIDGSIYLVALDYFKNMFKRKNIKFKLWFLDQDLFLLLFLPLISFFLFVNQLRFRWAYSSRDNPLMSLLVLFWFTVVLLLNFIYFKDDREKEKEEKEEKEKEEKDN